MFGPLGNPLLDPKLVAERAGISTTNKIPDAPSFVSKLDIVTYGDHMQLEDVNIWDRYFSDPELTWEYRMGSEYGSRGNTFFIHPLKHDPWMPVLLSQIEKITGLPLSEPNNVLDYYVNGQVMGQDGGIHADTEHLQPWWTILYFPMDWEDEWGGPTKFFRSNLEFLMEVPVKRGNILCFPGNVLHQGCAPLVPNKMRMSVAIKTNLRFDVHPVKKY